MVLLVSLVIIFIVFISFAFFMMYWCYNDLKPGMEIYYIDGFYFYDAEEAIIKEIRIKEGRRFSHKVIVTECGLEFTFFDFLLGRFNVKAV